jgi:hypothetical protein
MPDPMVHFGLIITGKGERQFLSTFLASLGRTGAARFEVIAQIGQRAPITSPSRRLKIVGRGMIITKKDQDEIGKPARNFMKLSPEHCVILIDDLEQASLRHVAEKFQRYRSAIDTMISKEPELKQRVAVHFLANMLEAYYFADAQAIQQYFNFPTELDDFEGDVETIGHPKGEIDALCKQYLGRGFHEIDDGWAIIRQLNLEHVLSNPETCTWLRALFAWCIEKIIRLHYGLDLSQENIDILREIEEDFYQLIHVFHLEDGQYADIPKTQLEYFGGGGSMIGS